MEINVKRARERFSELLHIVHEGEEVTILKHGKQVARMVPPVTEKKKLPSLADFRKTIKIKGEPVSKVVLQNREEDPY